MQRYDDGAGRGRINISSAFAPLLRNLNIREASDPTALILDNVPIGQKSRTERGKPPDRVVAEEGAVETDCHYGHWPFTEFTNRKVRMSRNTEENVHIVGLPSLFVTRHSRISSQIAKIRADFLHKTGLSCINLSKVLTFSGSPAGKSLRKTRNFQGLEIFFRGPDGKVPRRNFFAAARRPFFLPVGAFSRAGLACHFVGGIPVQAFPPSELPRREFPAPRQKDNETAFPHDTLIPANRAWLRFFRAVPALAPNTRVSENENEQIVSARPKVTFCHRQEYPSLPVVHAPCITTLSEQHYSFQYKQMP